MFGSWRVVRRSLPLAVLIVLLVGTAWFAERWPAHPGSSTRSCPAGSDTVRCYSDIARRIARAEGIIPALHYVETEVWDQSGFSSSHLIMHVVGIEAYRHTRDLGEAMAYLGRGQGAGGRSNDLGFPPPAISRFIEWIGILSSRSGMGVYPPSDPHLLQNGSAVPTSDLSSIVPSESGDFFRHDGFGHGVVQAFFRDRRDGLGYRELFQLACPERYPTDGADLNIEHFSCFHGIGHAVMYAEGNDIMKSLPVCDLLSESWQRSWCYHGVFMENGYLHLASYYPEEPRPNVGGDPLWALCNGIQEIYRSACARYVGEADLNQHRDFGQAFMACRGLAEPYRAICAARLALHSLPLYFPRDFQRIWRTCEDPGREFKNVCVRNAAKGIQRGWGLYFCAELDPPQREQCRAILDECFRAGLRIGIDGQCAAPVSAAE